MQIVEAWCPACGKCLGKQKFIKRRILDTCPACQCEYIKILDPEVGPWVLTIEGFFTQQLAVEAPHIHPDTRKAMAKVMSSPAMKNANKWTLETFVINVAAVSAYLPKGTYITDVGSLAAIACRTFS